MLGKNNLKTQAVSVASNAVGNLTSMSYVNQQVGSVIDGAYRIKGEVVIEHKDGSETNIAEFMKTVGERLCVLQPNFEAMEEYPALKDAYDQYKMLEKLLMENNDAKKD